MTAGDIVIARLPQANGELKNRPTVLLCELRPYGDFLLCGISSKLHQEVPGFDHVIRATDNEFERSGLTTTSVIRLGFLSTVTAPAVIGRIGSITPHLHGELLGRLADFLRAQYK